MILPENFHIAHPGWLYVIPVILCMLLLRRRRGTDGSIIFPTLKFIKHHGTKPRSLAGRLGAFCFVLAAICFTIALSRPQQIEDKSFRVVNGIDIMIAFDLSYSMNTTDMVLNRNYVTRLRAAKDVINQFIGTRPDDRLGVVGFAGKTKSFCPLTLDHDLVKYIIQSFHPELIHENGTAIGSAIAAAATRLDERKDTKSKIIILVTDGASNSGQITPLVAAENAAKLGIKIYTIAVGTESGTMANGMVSHGEFDEPTLRKIAALTSGEHFRAASTDAFSNAFKSINQLEKSEATIHNIRHIEDFFMYFVIAGGSLTLLGLLLHILRPTPAP